MRSLGIKDRQLRSSEWNFKEEKEFQQEIGKSRLLSALSCRCLKEGSNVLSGSFSYPLRKIIIISCQLGSGTLVAVFNTFCCSNLWLVRSPIKCGSQAIELQQPPVIRRLEPKIEGSSVLLSLSLMQCLHCTFPEASKKVGSWWWNWCCRWDIGRRE